MCGQQPEFKYDRRIFLLRSIFISVFFVSSILLLVLNTTVVWLLLFLLLFFITLFIFGISPMMTCHTVNSDGLTLRQGIYFKKEIPWRIISEVGEKDREALGHGVYASLRHSRVVVTTGKHGLVRVGLKKKIRFGYVLGKNADEIIIDVRDTGRFLQEIEKGLAGREETD